MDNISHTIFACALAEAGLNRIAPRSWNKHYATWLVALGANGPDIDVFWAWGGNGARYLTIHRGITHSFVASPFIAAIAALLVWLWFRRKSAGMPFYWSRAIFLGWIGVLSHLLLDFITPYGTRLFWPFSSARVAWDIFPVLDLWLMPLVLIAMLLPFFFRLISSEIGATKTSFRPAAIFVLIVFALLGTGRALAHRRVLAQLDSYVYHGRDPVRVSAYPESASPFEWHCVIDTQATFEQVDVNVFREFDPTATRSAYPPEPHPAIDAARKTATAQAFLDFAEYPYIYMDTREDGYEVVFRDLRYEYGTMMLRKGAVTRVELDKNLRVVSEHFSFRDAGVLR